MDEDGFFMGELDGVRGLVPSNFLTEAPDQYSNQGPNANNLAQRTLNNASNRGRGIGPGGRGPPPPSGGLGGLNQRGPQRKGMFALVQSGFYSFFFSFLRFLYILLFYTHSFSLSQNNSTFVSFTLSFISFANLLTSFLSHSHSSERKFIWFPSNFFLISGISCLTTPTPLTLCSAFVQYQIVAFRFYSQYCMTSKTKQNAGLQISFNIIT